MQAALPSRTALSTALMRAAHTRLDAEPLIEDAWGERLVDDAQRETLRRDARERLGAVADDGTDGVLYTALQGSPAFANVILRTRYTEDALRESIAAGTRQYVLIGAGLDSFSLRRPAWAHALEIFEIDHPATQGYKLERLRALGEPADARVHYVAADLATESLSQALARSPFAPRQPSFFSWLGVTMYLTREANLATLGAIARSAPPGSRLSFTYLESRAFSEPTPAFARIQARVSGFGEPFLSGFDPQHLPAALAALGMRLIDDVNGAEAAARYGRPLFARAGTSRLALAEIADP